MTVDVPRLPFALDPLIAEAKRRMRRRRFLFIGLLVAGVSLGFGVAFTAHSGPSPGGGSPAGSASNSLRPTSKIGEPPKPQTQAGYISYPSEGVRLGPPPEGLTPGLSAGEALYSFDRTGYGEFGGSSPPSVTLHTAQYHGNTFPAWVVTYRNTRPVSYGPAQLPATSNCKFVGVYNLHGGAWATFFQDCQQ